MQGGAGIFLIIAVLLALLLQPVEYATLASLLNGGAPFVVCSVRQFESANYFLCIFCFCRSALSQSITLIEKTVFPLPAMRAGFGVDDGLSSKQ